MGDFWATKVGDFWTAKTINEEKNSLFPFNPVKNKIHSIKLKEIDINHTKLLTEAHWNQLNQLPMTNKQKLLLQLLYYGGLRLNELRLLKKSDFNRETESIRLMRKGGYIHHLKIQNFSIIYQQFILVKSEMRTHREYLFHGANGEAYSSKTVYNQIKQLLHKAQLSSELGPHSFRKACATNLYKKTKDLILVKNYLNHKDAKVTQTYIEI